MKKVDQILKIIKKYDFKKQDLDSEITKSSQITFIQFTCSTINPKFLLDQQNPQNYVSLNPKGNNMETDLPTLEKFYIEINKIYPTKIIILIGNTDPFYIYSEEGKIYPNISNKELLLRYNKQWSKYKRNLADYLKLKYPKLEIEIISWYELEVSMKEIYGWDFRKQFSITKRRIKQLFKESDFEWELRRLKDQFGPGKYFFNLKVPADKTLKRWILRKFTEYAVQGLWIKLLFPDAILLQNEKPSNLRSSMYQPLIKELLNSKLPIIYPFGIDNSGYQ